MWIDNVQVPPVLSKVDFVFSYLAQGQINIAMKLYNFRETFFSQMSYFRNS